MTYPIITDSDFINSKPDEIIRQLSWCKATARKQHIAAMADCKSEAKSHDNEDAHTYLWKMRRDKLLELLSRSSKYSWRKCKVALMELKYMGYDVTPYLRKIV